jgi:hypothetical protein
MRVGDHVKLKPFPETNQPAQAGVVIFIGISTCIIDLDLEYWSNDAEEDGIREVAFYQIEETIQ